jgi:hypothetical protein
MEVSIYGKEQDCLVTESPQGAIWLAHGRSGNPFNS